MDDREQQPARRFTLPDAEKERRLQDVRARLHVDGPPPPAERGGGWLLFPIMKVPDDPLLGALVRLQRILMLRDLGLGIPAIADVLARVLSRDSAAVAVLPFVRAAALAHPAAIDRAFAAAGGVPAFAACAVAKARTSEAAVQVASIAHALHGAMGITEEYDLQLCTRRLHEWRMAHGSETYWHRQLGQLFFDSPATSSTDFVRTLL